MGVSEILAQIDREIAQLQQARALLNGASGGNSMESSTTGNSKGRKKRRLTPEGRRRIREAVKRRWALQRKKAAAEK